MNFKNEPRSVSPVEYGSLEDCQRKYTMYCTVRTPNPSKITSLNLAMRRQSRWSEVLALYCSI
jgi:hypothetical protein